jgi:hypothetical protein
MQFDTEIPTGGPPLSFISGTRNVPQGPGPEFGRRIRETDPNAAGGHLHLPNGEWTITADCFVKPMPKLEYHRHLTDGELLWHQRIPRSEMHGRMEEIFLNHYSFNDVCRRGWQAAERYLRPLLQEYNGTLVDQNPEDRRNFLALMHKPESQWRHLFNDGSKLLQHSDAYIMMLWLCKEGILTRYNPVGSVLVQPQITYAPTELPRKSARTQMTRADEGVAYITNIWGARACQGAHLFEILKRVRNRTNGQWSHFASVPYASMHKNIPDIELEYKGVSGLKEIGVAFYRGRVLDVLGSPAYGEELQVIQGLRGTTLESKEASNHAAKLKVLLVSADRIF